MNRDKDIEILKEFKEKGFASLMIKYNKNRIQTNTMVEMAIENVLKELETYKKVAEKLAEKLTYERGRKQDYMFCIEICEENWCDNKNCNQCMENIIEWARNEVEE